MAKVNFCNKILLHLKVIVFTVLYLFVAPACIILLIPIYIFRFIASQARKVLRPDLHKLVNTRSSVLSCDDFDRKPGWNLVVWLTQEGILDLDKFRKDFLQEFVNAKSPNGDLRFPEYQQHYSRWWGFQFWKWDKTFNINNHIRQYDGPHQDLVIDDTKLLQIIKELTWKPWAKDKSPWEFLQIRNYQMTDDFSNVTKSILIFRIHHGFGDGYFILKLLLEDICGISLAKALDKPQYVKRNIFIRIILALLFWIRIPYEFVEMITTAADKNAWHIPQEKMKRPMNAALTPQIKLDFVKEIKTSHKVTFTAVIMAAITGGIRNMMIKKGIDVPEELHVTLPVPMINHPPKCRNHFIYSFVSLPVGCKDPLKRLKRVNQNLFNLKKSTAPTFAFMKIPLLGGMFRWMVKPLVKNTMSTCLMTIFPGTPVIPIFKGVKVLDMMFGTGLGEGNVGLGFTLISHTDHIRLLSAADPNILISDLEVQELNQKIIEEILIFRELGTV